MRSPTRYALGMRCADGRTWLAARDPSRSGPMRTDRPDLAHGWESPADLQSWLDSIPAKAEGHKSNASPRGWMREVELFAVPVRTTAGEPVPLADSGPGSG